MHRSLPLAAALALAALLPAQDGGTAYRNARILPGGAPAIANGTLVVGGGKVLAVGGADTPVPDGATVVDCAGKTITPGLIDASFRAGNTPDMNENGAEVTPHLRVLDSLDPDDPSFVRARSAGVTTVHVMPGSRSVIGGLGSAVAEWLARGGPRRGILEAIGTPDAFISEAGSQKWMREQCGLTAPAVAERIAGRYRAVR